MEAKNFVRIYFAFGEHYRANELVGIFLRLFLLDCLAAFFYGAGAMVAKARIMSFVHAHINSLRVNYCVRNQIGRSDDDPRFR